MRYEFQRRPRRAGRVILGLVGGWSLALVACSSVDVQLTDGPGSSGQAAADSPSDADQTNAAPPTVSTTVPPTTVPPTTVLAPDLRPLPSDPSEVAAELEEAELKIRDAAVSPIDAMAYGRRQQQMYRVLSANPEIAPAVVAAVADSIRPAVELNWQARQNLSALVRSTTLSSVLPAWRIREPLPASDLIEFYEEAEAQTGIGWNYLAAINLVETRIGRIEGFSTAGAIGPMQFLPSTWAGCCVGDPADDHDAIVGAGVYLALVGGPGDMQRALFSYNRSQRYVDAVEAYAQVLAADPLAFRGYHGWEVYFLSSAGLIRIPAGYEEPEPVDAAKWLADHPEALVD